MIPTYASIPLRSILRSPTNPRQRFDEAKLAELAESIRSKGLLQPVLVRPFAGPEVHGDAYELVAGERRWRAAKLAGLEHITADVRELSDTDVLEIQIVENAQREDVHPLEEAIGYRRILESGMYGSGEAATAQLAMKVGKSIRTVYERLKLSDLIDDAKTAFVEDRISLGHAVLLCRLQPEAQNKALVRCLKDPADYSYLSVRGLANYISREVILKVSGFIFAADDATLLPQAGSCTACPKNTANAPLLLPDEEGAKKGLCTDRECYRAKMAAFEAAKAAEIAERRGVEPLKISTDYYAEGRKDVLTTTQYSHAKEGDKGAVPAIVLVDQGGKALYQERFVRVRESSATSKSPVPTVTPERRAELKRQKLENLTRFRVYLACLKAFDAGRGEGLISGAVARVVVAKVALTNQPDSPASAQYRASKVELIDEMKWRESNSGHDRLPSLKQIQKMPGGSADLAKLAFRACVQDEVTYSDCVKPSGYALFTFAEALGVDANFIRHAATLELMTKKERAEYDASIRARPPASPNIVAPEPAVSASVADDPPPETESPVKRKRGRPRKAGAITVVAETGVETIEEEVF